MKDLIVLSGILPILLSILIGYGQMIKASEGEQDVREYVYAAAQVAKQDGCFTAENISHLEEKIAARLGIDEDEILITADSVPKYRVNNYNERELIHYRVEAPIKGVVPLTKAGRPNQKIVTIENEIASERLPQ